ncbi:hypothetical protein A3C37_03940 [Candidatus Peribacteria bacterium RIFCSPHIGHO2_02_FULL_53_20]|nr:MAG: hypothetical protein A3C37_03940 [Candidatus Peribacteria bacterium RIFCSPHIGHO2_02_FULL_53_20]OGJ69968.1 MAG: hypothetical protein A3G69_02720 [Candidatus Peribacteria bacterium RIFCSPLOWO2_12_FULL_53_10]
MYCREAAHRMLAISCLLSFVYATKESSKEKRTRAPEPLRPALCLDGNACKASAFPSRLPPEGGKQGLPPHPPWRAEPRRLLQKIGKILKMIFFTVLMRHPSKKWPNVGFANLEAHSLGKRGFVGEKP